MTPTLPRSRADAALLREDRRRRRPDGGMRRVRQARYGLPRESVITALPPVEADVFLAARVRPRPALALGGRDVLRRRDRGPRAAAPPLRPAVGRGGDRLRRGADARFVLLGRGDEGDLEKLCFEPVERLGLGRNVLFPGYLYGDQYPPALRSLDAFLFLVPGSDGTCRAVREAFATGLPVVSTDLGILPELVGGGGRGFSVPARAADLARRCCGSRGTAHAARLARSAPARGRGPLPLAARASAARALSAPAGGRRVNHFEPESGPPTATRCSPRSRRLRLAAERARRRREDSPAAAWRGAARPAGRPRRIPQGPSSARSKDRLRYLLRALPSVAERAAMDLVSRADPRPEPLGQRRTAPLFVPREAWLATWEVPGSPSRGIAGRRPGPRGRLAAQASTIRTCTRHLLRARAASSGCSTFRACAGRRTATGARVDAGAVLPRVRDPAGGQRRVGGGGGRPRRKIPPGELRRTVGLALRAHGRGSSRAHTGTSWSPRHTRSSESCAGRRSRGDSGPERRRRGPRETVAGGGIPGTVAASAARSCDIGSAGAGGGRSACPGAAWTGDLWRALTTGESPRLLVASASC